MKLPPLFTENNETINAVIETPKGSHNKYDYDEEYDFFRLNKTLPCGTSFPLDFGFIPHTLGEDGDPLDVLVIMESPAFTGAIVECRIVGVLEAEQKEKGKKPFRNDRILAVATASICYSTIKKTGDIDKHLIDEVVHFFEYYNEMAGKKFRLIGKKGKNAAMELIMKNRK